MSKWAQPSGYLNTASVPLSGQITATSGLSTSYSNSLWWYCKNSSFVINYYKNMLTSCHYCMCTIWSPHQPCATVNSYILHSLQGWSTLGSKMTNLREERRGEARRGKERSGDRMRQDERWQGDQEKAIKSILLFSLARLLPVTTTGRWEWLRQVTNC